VKPCCRSCAFFMPTKAARHPGFALGLCRRFPPNQVAGGTAVQPVMFEANWCGEFRPADPHQTMLPKPAGASRRD
jgi:hypothetical protein